MTTSIQLGNIFTDQSGTTRVSGGASGFDIESLVNGLSDARRLPAVVLEERIEENAIRSEAFAELNALASTFRDAANFLRNPPGVNNADENIFEFRSANVTATLGSDANSFISISAEPGTAIGQFDITVDQVAERTVKTTDTFTISNADPEVADEDVSIVGGGGPFNAGTLVLGANGTAIELEDGDSLNQVITKVNAASDDSGVQASFIRVADGEFRISFASIDTGLDTNYDIVAANPTTLNTTFAIETDGQDAQVTIDGTEVTRETNNFSDVIDGLTFSVSNETPVGEELRVDIEPDTELTRQGILNFVESYNAIRIYTAQQNELGDDGQPTESSILAGDSTLRLITARINAELANQVDGLGDFSRLSDLGITFNDFPGDADTPFTRNILTLNEEQLDSALATNYDGVRDIFEFNLTSDNANLQVFERTNGLSVSEFSVNVDSVNDIYTATFDDNGTPKTVNFDVEVLSGGGLVLNGQDGTELEGLVLLFSDPTDTTINVRTTQGVADRIFNSLDELLAEDTGAINVAIQSIADDEDRFTEDIARIDARVERFRESLIAQFSALEAAISSANTLLQSLDAQANARNN